MINSSHLIAKFKAIGDYEITPIALTETSLTATEITDHDFVGWFVIFPSIYEERKITDQQEHTIYFDDIDLSAVSEAVISYSNFQIEIIEAIKYVDLQLKKRNIDKNAIDGDVLDEIYTYKALAIVCKNKAKDKNDDIFYLQAEASEKETQVLIDEIVVDINGDGYPDNAKQIFFIR